MRTRSSNGSNDGSETKGALGDETNGFEGAGRRLRHRDPVGLSTISLSSSCLNGNISESSGRPQSVASACSLEGGQKTPDPLKRQAYRRCWEKMQQEDADCSQRSSQRSSRNCCYSEKFVRRSTRQRKTIYNKLNEGWLCPDDPGYSYDLDGLQKRVIKKSEEVIEENMPVTTRSRRYELKETTEFESAGREKKPKSSELRRLGLENEEEEDEGDMYSRIKTARRRLVTNQEASTNLETETEATTQDSSEENEDKEEKEQQNLRRSRRRKRIIETETASSNSDLSETEIENVGPTKYHLRRRRKITQRFGFPDLEMSLRRRQTRQNRQKNYCESIRRPVRRSNFRSPRRRLAHHSSTSSEDEMDEDLVRFEKRTNKSMARARASCLPLNFQEKDVRRGILRDRQKIGSSLADIDPMSLDTSLLFDQVGGLDEHIQSLKEMILFPMLYPEVFELFKTQPPRGVLFHGPPGTGKTLVARALANECSNGSRKVAFFMRKGADCLSKWVGESERQLRLLFDQAFLMRPSIIFFDEIDGIAPVRSTRQDQIHSSIVSTLLALMDGLDNRGEIVVIGATNRIDSIDPALRRPGRFDREFYFSLPTCAARERILTIHTNSWPQPLPSSTIQQLAQLTPGYCGADMKALCAETALIALKRRYPQIYSSRQKLLLNVNEINIEMKDFFHALSKITPASSRSIVSPSRPLNAAVKPLLSTILLQAADLIKSLFPVAQLQDKKDSSQFAINQSLNVDLNCANLSSITPNWTGNYRPRFLLYGNPGQGQSSHLGPALLHYFEHISHVKLDLSVLYGMSMKSPEEAVAGIFSESIKQAPCIIYMPRINLWWNALSETLKITLLTLIKEMDPSKPILLFATADTLFDELPDDLQEIYYDKAASNCSMSVRNPDEEEIREFFRFLFQERVFQLPETQKKDEIVHEDLPVAPTPEPRPLTESELKKLGKQEDVQLRQLRMFLREILGKLMRDRRFQLFVKPVDVEEVPDYLEVIEQPMALENMMTKIDAHEYESAAQFLEDVELICRNALEYNPDRDPTDKQIRHRACALKDFAHALIEAEMDSDFEQTCQEISKARKERGVKKNSIQQVKNFGSCDSKAKEDGNVTDATEIDSYNCSFNPCVPNGAKNEASNGSTCNSIPQNTSIQDDKILESNINPCPKKRASRFRRKSAKKIRLDHTNTEKNSSGKENNPAVQENSFSVDSDVTNDSLYVDTSSEVPRISDNEDVSIFESQSLQTLSMEIIVDKVKVDALYDSLISNTSDCCVEELEVLHSKLLRIVNKYSNELNQSEMLKELQREIDSFIKEKSCKS